MKEIIKNGKSDETIIKYYTTCPHCLCEFTYEFEDMIRDNFGIGNLLISYPSCYTHFPVNYYYFLNHKEY